MKLVSKAAVMKFLTRVVIIVIAAKALSLGVLWFLPSEGISRTSVDSVQPAYSRYSFESMLEYPAKASGAVAAKGGASATATIDDLVLKGLYGKGAYGFVIVALKSAKNKTEVVGVGEAFKGYRLVSVEAQSAIFDYRGKRYKVMIEESGTLNAASMKRVEQVPQMAPMKQVSRSQIDSYTKNLDQVWKDIGIQEVKRGARITGFKVTRIRAGTPLAELGLRRGDVIIKANNKPLDSYAAAMEIYQSISRLNVLELVVLRNNQEQEILYEIY